MSNVLLCASEAGGVRNLIPLLVEIARQNAKVTFVTNSILVSLLPPETEAYEILTVEDCMDEMEATVERVDPIAVICGTTCYPNSAELVFLQCARRRGICGVAVVDEWYNYRQRFATGSELRPLVLPDVIALPDERAVREAVSEGLPVERCVAAGSPALADVWEKGERWRVEPPGLPGVLAGTTDRPVFVFMSETHAADNGGALGESGLLGDYLGYTETIVRDVLLELLSGLGEDVVFVEKLHPTAPTSVTPTRVPTNVDFRVARSETLELAAHCSAVIGMRSMALLEAKLLGCHVASFQPGLIGAERCTAVRLGLVRSISDRKEMGAWLLAALSSPREQTPSERPYFAHAAAAASIVQLTLGFAPSWP